jgi:DNA-binding CsgD family transcriptional regulator
MDRFGAITDNRLRAYPQSGATARATPSMARASAKTRRKIARPKPRRRAKAGPTSAKPASFSAGLDLDGLGAVAACIATPDFYPQLMQTVAGMLSADLAMVMRYSRHSAPDYVVHEDLVPEHIELYRGGLYRVDPVYRLCRSGEPRGVFTLDDVTTPAERFGDYFNVFLALTGMADDLVVLFPGPAGTSIGLAYERKTVFRGPEVKRLRQIFPLLEGLQAAHERLMLAKFASLERSPDKPIRIVDHRGQGIFESKSWQRTLIDHPGAASKLSALDGDAPASLELAPGLVLHAEPLDAGFALAPNGRLLLLETADDGLPPLDYGQATAGFLEDRLTPRERDIVGLMLLGFPTLKVAERLGLSVNTVKNHKKRLYHKLDITTERELFLNFVSYLFGQR